MNTHALEDRVVLVTGASGDIGRAIAVACARAGAKVGLVARRSDELTVTADEIRAAGGPATAVAVADITDQAELTGAVQSVAQALGPVTVLVNNAGGARFTSPLLETRRSGWDSVQALNVTAPFLASAAVVPGMIEAGGGCIVNVSSLVALKAQDGLAHYGAAKSALLSLTRTMAREWGVHGIRANAVIPGLVRTSAWDHYESEPEMDGLTGSDIPLRRWATPREIAEPVVFLASDAASYVTGAHLLIDGGVLA
jgi:NAD(P)-dependent dehydrogenase (short-subunit alcohol dehydrogenase family)